MGGSRSEVPFENVFSLTGPILGYLTAVLFLTCISLSYVNYGMFHGSWTPLPTISETWTFTPFTYVSRVVVGVGSSLLIALHVIVYESSKTKDGASVLLFVGVFASGCLAIVAAVCVDETSPQCLGSVSWHDSTAVLFFVLMDVYMTALTARDDEKNLLGLRYSVGLSLLTKLRYAAPLLAWHLGPTLAVIEYIQISAILQFMLTYLRAHAPNFRLGLIRVKLDERLSSLNDLEAPLVANKNKGPTVTIGTSVSGLQVVVITLMLGFVVLFFPLLVSISRDSAPDEPFILPELSATYVLPPGNYIARLVGVQGCLAWLVAVLAMRWSVFPEVQSDNAWRDAFQNNFSVIVAFLAGGALSLTLCVSTLEHQFTHQFLAGFFFACYNVFQLILTSQIAAPDSTESTEKEPRAQWLAASALISTASKIRLAFPVGQYRIDDALFNVLELVDVLSMLGFVAVFAWFGSKTLGDRIALAVFQFDP